MKIIVAILIAVIVIFIAFLIFGIKAELQFYITYITIMEDVHPDYNFREAYPYIKEFYVKYPSLVIFNKDLTDEQNKEFGKVIAKVQKGK